MTEVIYAGNAAANTAARGWMLGHFMPEGETRAVVLVARGDYVLYRGVGHTWQAEQASVVIVIRWPSLRHSDPGVAGHHR